MSKNLPTAIPTPGAAQPAHRTLHGGAAAPAPVKLGFILVSNSRAPQPSTRIAVLNMLGPLRAADFEPHIVFEPSGSEEQPQIPDIAARIAHEGFRIVVFQKVAGPSIEHLAHRLRALGVRTVYAVCDLIETPMVAATDATIAVTDFLRGCYPPALQDKIFVVNDGIERPDVRKSAWRADAGTRYAPLGAVLVTSSCLGRLPVIGQPPEWLKTRIVGRYPPRWRPILRLKHMRWQMQHHSRTNAMDHLRFVLDRRIARIPWDPVGVYEELVRADIGILPIEGDEAAPVGSPAAKWRLKSENRLTMKMSAGLPVVATPIPAYEAVIEHGVNGFLARSRSDWHRALEALRDPGLRREMGERARASVAQRFSRKEQWRRLSTVLAALLHESRGQAERELGAIQPPCG